MNIEPFDSFDDMMAYLRKQMDAADSAVQPWQEQIKAGDYFSRASGHGFNIYGEVLPDEGPRERHVRHYRFCQCYSIACPDGEMGDVHVSTIEQLLSREDFEKARERRWQP
jgi:hypothetical protein